MIMENGTSMNKDLLRGALGQRISDQKVDQPKTRSLPTFYRNLEEALDLRRASHSLYATLPNHWQTGCGVVDLSSNDILSWSATGKLRSQFLAELTSNPEFTTGSGGSRLIDGSYPYLEQVEQEVAAYHGGETGLIFGSGRDGNIAIWTAIPRPGDVIVYDALVHASTHEGMSQTLAADKVEFAHNSVDDFRTTLLSILDTHPQIKQGRRSVIIAVESVYSMDGDMCPLNELLEVVKELFGETHDNAHFVVDESHSTGVIGPRGAGFVCELGLESEVAITLHNFGKGLGATGGIVLGNKTIRTALVNFPRSFIFTKSPAYPFIAAIRAGYQLLDTPEAEEASGARQHIQDLSIAFFQAVTDHPDWKKAQNTGILHIPLAKDWEDRSFHTHVITIKTRHQYTYWLYFHLLGQGFCGFPVEHPVVPVGQSKLKLTLHAGNTLDEIDRLVSAIFCWVEEILTIEEKGGENGSNVTHAASEVYEWMRAQGMTAGYGML